MNCDDDAAVFVPTRIDSLHATSQRPAWREIHDLRAARARGDPHALRPVQSYPFTAYPQTENLEFGGLT